MANHDVQTITGLPDHDHAVARCFGKSGRVVAPRSNVGHGVTWKRVSGATLQNLTCPFDGGRLIQTTRSWRNNGWVVIPEDVVKKAASSKRAEKKAATARLAQRAFAVVDDAAPVGNVLDRFATEAEASAFISTLPGHLDGRYSLDGPER